MLGPMPSLAAPDYQVARFVLERGIAAVYVIAFVVAARQFPALCGERGLEPAARFLALVPFRRAPSLFHLRYSDRLLEAATWIGAAVSFALLVGLPQSLPLPITMLAWVVPWVLYQSIVNIGGTFYAFGWETLLLEAGFLAIFLGDAGTAPSWLVILAFRWLAFRIEFGAGLIKLRGDRCWRDLTCMDYHHQTQPLPNPLSWWFHHLPRSFHRLEVLGNFAAQLVLPWGLFLPQPFASIVALLMIATQLYLVVSGNYAWLNWLTIIAIVAGLSDPALRAVLPLGPAATPAGSPAWFLGLTVLLAGLVAVLSWWPVRNMASPGQAMNASFDPLHLVNTYGAFGSVTRERIEVVVEGTASPDPLEEEGWREYEFRAKPGDPRRMPPQVAPYHLRLDWLMWFIPLSPSYAEGWFIAFLTRLLQADPATLRLIRRDPFEGTPPVYVRARMFRYEFTDTEERRATGRWWRRTYVSAFVQPIRLREEVREAAVETARSRRAA